MNKKEDDQSSFLNDSQDTLESYFENRKNEELERLSLIENLNKIRNNDIYRQRMSLHITPNFNSLKFLGLQGMLNKSIFDTKLIMQKEFNIFDLEKKVGHHNVLPIMGRTMLDSFGLIDEKIMPINFYHLRHPIA